MARQKQAESISKNHEAAPECATFVKAMREAFGEITVIYVKEGEFERGAPAEGNWVQPVIFADMVASGERLEAAISDRPSQRKSSKGRKQGAGNEAPGDLLG